MEMFSKANAGRCFSFLSRFRLALVLTVCLMGTAAALLIPKSNAAPAGDPCVPPGLLLLTDPSGDTGTGTLGTVPGSPAQDITEILIAEPGQPDGVARLAF